MTRAVRTGGHCAGATDVVVIGAGHSGLAMSAMLLRHGVEHVVLERGQVGNAWRQRRWQSLRLLTPNRLTRLPGFSYSGTDPDGFMPAAELVAFLERYAAHVDAPVMTNTAVTSVRRQGNGYRITSTRGDWLARAVVLANGASAVPAVPAMASDLPGHVTQLTPLEYRSPIELEPGGVLVVGASATGLQFADELAASGREVTLAVGEHVRLPRRYRGRDIFDWMIKAGIMDQSYREIDDLSRGRRLPSPQLEGSGARPILDLNALSGRGVTLAGRLMGSRNAAAQFSGSLANLCALADLKMKRLLKTIDEHIGNDPRVPPPERFADTRVTRKPPLALRLDDGRVRTVIWATGFRPDYRWLRVPVFDRKGRLMHDGGVLSSPGLYVMGLPLMRRRKSSFIFGATDDARAVTRHLLRRLRATRAARAALA